MDALCVGGYARKATDITSVARCGASARLATHAFDFSCGGSDGGRGELECKMGRELGREAEAARVGPRGRSSASCATAGESILTHVIAYTGTCQWPYRATNDRLAAPTIQRHSPSNGYTHEYIPDNVSLLFPHCLPTSTCLPLLGRLRRHLPGHKSENERYVPCTCYDLSDCE